MPGVAACAWPTFAARSHPGSHSQHASPSRPPLGSWHRKKQQANVCRCRIRANAGVDAAERPIADPYSQPQQAEPSLEPSLQNGTSVDSNGASTSVTSPLATEAALAQAPADLVPPSSTYTKAQRKSLANIPESEMTPEELRRWRISKANRGKQAWNKGRRHSPETLEKIRLGTANAMKRPEVIGKVRANHLPAMHSAESKAKISAAVNAAFKRKQQRRLAEEAANPEATRLAKEAKEAAMAEKRAAKKAAQELAAQERAAKKAAKLALRKAPLTAAEKAMRAAQHRQRISEAIKQKWRDPEYRMRVSTSLRSRPAQTGRVSNHRESRTRQAQKQLQAAIEWQEKLDRAANLLKQLQATLQAGQEQAEALRYDPAGFARQQRVLDNARQLVRRAKIQVAELEGNMPSLHALAEEMEARPDIDDGMLVSHSASSSNSWQSASSQASTADITAIANSRQHYAPSQSQPGGSAGISQGSNPRQNLSDSRPPADSGHDAYWNWQSH